MRQDPCNYVFHGKGSGSVLFVPSVANQSALDLLSALFVRVFRVFRGLVNGDWSVQRFPHSIMKTPL